MRVFVRVLLIGVFFAAVGLVVFLLLGPKQKETWATLTAVLAVIAAVISAWPSLRVLEIQEDATRPNPVPFFAFGARDN
jgi:heme/copper-type cytochrome/quinol oxidase subunit 4